MTTYAEMTETATAKLLEAAKPIEEFAKSFAASTVETVSKLPALSLPESVASPVKIVTAQFALVEKLLSAQKNFALGIASASAKTATEDANKS